MMGVSIDGPTYLFADNISIIISSTLPQSSLKKRYNALAYHHIHEAVAAGIIQMSHIDGKGSSC
jgi:hypothetical protein